MVKRGKCENAKIVHKHFHAANKDDNLAARRKIMKAENARKITCYTPYLSLFLSVCVWQSKFNVADK